MKEEEMDKYVLRRPKKVRATFVRMDCLERLAVLPEIIKMEVISADELRLTMADEAVVDIGNKRWLVDHGEPIRLSETSGSKDHRRWEVMYGGTFNEFYKRGVE